MPVWDKQVFVEMRGWIVWLQRCANLGHWKTERTDKLRTIWTICWVKGHWWNSSNMTVWVGVDNESSRRDCRDELYVSNQCATGTVGIHNLHHLLGVTEFLWTCPECIDVDLWSHSIDRLQRFSNILRFLLHHSNGRWQILSTILRFLGAILCLKLQLL